MTTLYLVRHAEADGNIYRRVHGQYDGYITPNGERQIALLRERFAHIPVDAVYASDLYRTRRTATAIYEDKHLTLNLAPELREFHFGVWEDLPWGQLHLFSPEEYAVWNASSPDFAVEGSETYPIVYARVKAKLDEICAQHPNESVAVVTHGTVIRALLCGILFREDFNRLSDVTWCDNTAVSTIQVENGVYTVITQNDNSHLREYSTLENQRWWRDNEKPEQYNLFFRPARFPEDLKTLDKYYHSAWVAVFGCDDYDSAECTARMKRMLAADPRAIVFACRGEETLGAILLDTRARVVPDAGHIALLYLEEPYRGKFYAAQLIGHAVSVYRGMGRKWLSVRVAENNKSARRFYEKLGFELTRMEREDQIKQLILRKKIYFE